MIIWDARVIIITEPINAVSICEFLSTIFNRNLDDSFVVKLSNTGLHPHSHVGLSLRINNKIESKLENFTTQFPSAKILILKDSENISPKKAFDDLIKSDSLSKIPMYKTTDEEQHKLMYYQKATIKDLPEDEIWHLFDSAEDWADHFNGSIPAEVEFNEKLMLETAKTDPGLAFKVENAILQTKTN